MRAASRQPLGGCRSRSHTRWNREWSALVSAGMDALPDDVMSEIRKHVQAGRLSWEDTLREREEQRLLDAVFGGEREH